MKTYSLFARLGSRLTRPLRRLSPKRRGTVIIIVLALLGLLTLIGFFAVTFTGQENQNATYFANNPTAKVATPTLPADPYFDDILRQLIIGPAIAEKQSVLWGGNKALLPTMFGRDMAMYNGRGVNLIWNNTTNLPAIDQNFDGFADSVTAGQPNLMQLNFSPVAQGGNVINFNSFSPDVTLYPDPDSNITYPDINNAFLASDTLVPNGTGNPVRVITPSFHRPALLRNLVPSNQWYTSSTTAPYVLYPHVSHLAIDSSGAATSTPRYVSNANPDTVSTAGAWAANTAYALGQAINATPQGSSANTYVCTTAGTSGGTPPVFPAVTGAKVTDGTVVWTDTSLQPFFIPGDDGIPPQEGVWTPEATWAASVNYTVGAIVIPVPPNGQGYLCTTAGTSSSTQPTWPTSPGATVSDGSVVWTDIGPTINYDVDTDNDGVPDSRYMDFGFPLMVDSLGNQFVALGAVKMIDADALLNLNVHGNRAALAQLPVNTNFAGGNNPAFLSLSDHGVSASEVNPQWALNARVFFNGGTGLYSSPDFSGSGATQSAAVTAALQQYTMLFRPGGSGNNPLNNFDSTEAALSYEQSNMEWWSLLNGRPQLSAGTPPTVSGSSFVGRWGENTTRLDPNVTSILAGNTLSAGVSASSDPFPLPGTSGVDDNNNNLEGGNFSDVQGVFHPAFVQPVDFFSAGNWVTGTQGKQRLLYPYQTQGTVAGNEQFPQYSQFFIAPTVGWANVLSAALVPVTTFPAGGTSAKLLTDDPDETWTEPAYAAQQTTDSIFGASENAIQLSGADYNNLGNPGRTASLMPFNFVSNLRASLIRQRFTSTSWDLKSFGKQFLGAYFGLDAVNDARRLWEFSDLSGASPPTGPFRFPPNFGPTGSLLTPQTSGFTVPDDASSAFPAVYPLRAAVANLIQILANPNQSNQSTWAANTAYTVGQMVIPSPPNGSVYSCTAPGTSGASQPAWPTSPGSSVSDGSVTWVDLGPLLTNALLPQRMLSVNGLTEMYPNGTDSHGNTVYQFRFRPLTPHPSTAVNTFPAQAITPFPPASASSTTLPTVTWIAEPEQLQSGNLAQQEWLARYDRQRMARDIYTLLYLTGGGREANAWRPSTPYVVGALAVSSPPNGHMYICTNAGTTNTTQPTWPTSSGGTVTDGSVTWTADVAAGPPTFAAGTFANYATASNHPNSTTNIRPVYTDDQLQEMAQFAVNLVDALDPDSNITLFEYDKDLSDGWNLDDNAYDSAHDPIMTTQPLDRGIVYGVERQQICLNESMVTLYQPCINTVTTLAQGHPDIQWDSGSTTQSRQWSMFYTELENVGPVPINFNNAQWQIAVKQSPVMTSLSPYYGTGTGTTGEMRMTLVGSNVQSSSTLPTLAAGAATGGNSPRLTIGGMIGSGGTPQASGAIAGPPYNVVNPNPANPTVPAPSYMVIDPNDPTGTPGTQSNSTTFNYMYPIAPRAAYGTGPTATVASPWFGNATILAPASNGLDLIDPNQVNNYWIVPPNTTSPNADGTPVSSTPIAAGAQLTQFNDFFKVSTGQTLLPSTAPLVLRIELRRRADLNRVAIVPSSDPTGVQAADNPWITVDYMDVPVNVMALKITNNPNDFSVQVQGQLGGYYNATARTAYNAAARGYYAYALNSAGGTCPNVSTERSQPLYHDYQLNPFNPASTVSPPTAPYGFPNGPFLTSSSVVYSRNGGATTLAAPLWQGNSLGQDNDAAGFNPGTITAAAAIQPHPLYQPHYDRDFTSIGELFNVPLYGQPQTPQWFPNATYALGSVIVPPQPPSVPGTTGTGGLIMVCTNAGAGGATSGTSGGTEPTWPTSQGGTTGDGQLTWTAAQAAQMYTGLTHLMASRISESGAPTAGPAPTTELLVGADYVPNDPSVTVTTPQHYNGYGTAGFRLQHPEGGDQRNPNPDYAAITAPGTSDYTENRWFRALGFLEVPTRSHRGIDEPTNVAPYQIAAGSINGSLGFYRTPGKINLNTLRYPDIVAGLVGEPDIFNMNFTGALPTGQNLPANLSVPYLLHDLTNDVITNGPPQNTPQWTASLAYSVGNVVVPSAQNGYSYMCVTAGTSGGGQPSWPTPNPWTPGVTVTDGGVTWLVNPPYLVRDWWEQFITTRDGVDPLPVSNGGTGLSLPGMPRAPMLSSWAASTTYSLGATIIPPSPNGYTYVCTTPGTSGTSAPPATGTPPAAWLPSSGIGTPGNTVTDGTVTWTLSGITPSGSQPFHELGFSAYGGVDSNGYNGSLESTLLRSLSSDAISPPIGTTTAVPPTFDLRRRLFELGTNAQHVASNLDYATKQRLLSRLAGNTTTRSNVFFVWVQVDFFQAKDVGPSLTPADTGVVRIGSKLATSPAYRGFFVIDRSQALPIMTPQYLPSATTGQPFVFSFNQSFNWQSLVLFQQRIQ